MDCCNYVQPYHPGHSHFYQQQHFCYDNTNMNGYATTSTAYATAPISDSIEANARYARLQAAYPTDYVYNPKEARIRKAMREQCRELSRQSILQSTVTATNSGASATGANSTNGNVENIAGERGAPGAGGRGGAPAGTGGRGGSRCGSAGGRASDGGEIGTGNFLSHPTSYASPVPAATSSSLPSTSGYESRIINPWFPVGHTPPANLPIHSHRVMQAHQRTFDKSEEVLRKRAKCAGAFSAASAAAASSYPGDFTVHGAPTQAASGTSVGGLESNDYRGGGGSVSGIGEFSDAQKWHPYQNAAAAHHHPRIPLTRMTSRHPMQNINPQNHGPWNQQYFGLPLYPMATQNQMVRSPRHVVFVQNQQERHTAGYPDEMPMNYITNRIETSHRLQPSYSQNNYQETEKCIEDAPRWDQPSTSAAPPIANLVTSPREPERVRETQPPKKEETNKEYQKNVEPQPRTQSNQRLPGFPQAFGSTEIGRFSRTHNFADMVVPDNNVSDGSICSSSGSGIVPGNSNGNYVTFLEVPRVNCDCISHSNPLQVSQNFSTPTSTERPTFIYHDTQVPGGSRQANQSPEKKSSNSDSSNLSANSLTYSASTELKPVKNKSIEVGQKETQVKEENDNDDGEEEDQDEDEDESVGDEDEDDDDED
ncbi:uncharacterized protein LOC103579207 isoform X1 [Microplitis demolitor]|uniref:uncharacterized protein LOC103579207 isoform X1 n=2 Tax=Microplitis demolitor TaxID=69319 RepID=UPI0004CD179D|nr:uncharacterized protein LOC103579207 isoform X1 [Microplitis demolitor]